MVVLEHFFVADTDGQALAVYFADNRVFVFGFVGRRSERESVST